MAGTRASNIILGMMRGRVAGREPDDVTLAGVALADAC